LACNTWCVLREAGFNHGVAVLSNILSQNIVDDGDTRVLLI
jgi:hypothetical protein